MHTSLQQFFHVLGIFEVHCGLCWVCFYPWAA